MSNESASKSSQRSYRDILEVEIEEGLRQLDRPTGGVLLSGLSAGLDVGFSVFLMATMLTLTRDVLPEPVTEILVANMYAVGFIVVIIGRSELFTEHTTRAVLPVLDGRASLTELARLWVLVYVANVVGGAIFAWLSTIIGPQLGVIDPSAFGEIALSMVDHTWWIILLSAVLAGWMMGLLSWLVSAGRDTISQIFFVWMITGGIGFAHLHHSIAGTVEVLVGVFANQGVSVGDFGHFLVWTTLGNALGGVFFVALLKYSHVVRGGSEPEDVDIEDSDAAKEQKRRDAEQRADE